MTTLDFELEISAGSGGAYSVAARAPGGEATAAMRLPVASVDLDRHLDMVRDKVLASSARTTWV